MDSIRSSNGRNALAQVFSVCPRCKGWSTPKSQRRGSASALGVVMIGVMAVILGMTVDLGYIHVSQSELKRTSDAAALAACWELFDAKVAGVSDENAAAQVTQSANAFSSMNRVARSAPQLSGQSDDIQLGHFDAATNQFTMDSSADINAVRVSIHRQHGTNGEVPLFFGTVLGRQSQPMSSTSTAALIHNISGFYTPPTQSETIDLLPFALDEITWHAVVAGQTEDAFSWQDDRLTSAPNGKHECNLYPQGTGSPGNCGTVDIGSSNNSTKDIARQILSGISRDDLLIMSDDFEFNSDDELFLNGDTGISAGVKDELQSIVGQTRIIPVFREVTGNGNNASYKIVKFVGVRILEVKLTGRMNQKRLIVEPAPIVARHARINLASQSSSDFVYTPVMLVK